MQNQSDLGWFRRLMKLAHGPVYRSRLGELVEAFRPHLRAGDHVLDVGCGTGHPGRAIMDAMPGVDVVGLERHPRPGASIPVTGYEGETFPFPDNHFDAVIVADVLHHDTSPEQVLAECLRVARRCVLLKDHKTEGPGWTAPYRRICLMDWAANMSYGVKCLYDYPTRSGWQERFSRVGARVIEETERLQLYPRPYRWFFTPRLQYFVVLEKKSGGR